MSDTHTCPVDECERQHPSGHAMCKTHWKLVPRELQREVYRTARLMWNDEPDLETGYRTWREARDRAVAAVEEREAERVS